MGKKRDSSGRSAVGVLFIHLTEKYRCRRAIIFCNTLCRVEKDDPLEETVVEFDLDTIVPVNTRVRVLYDDGNEYSISTFWIVRRISLTVDS